jgi:acetyltransferase
MAVLTNAGGPGVTAADALEGLGLRLAALQPETRTRLQAILPPAASLNNPVDMLASASPQQYRDCLGILLADPGVHGVLVILPPPPMYTAGEVAQALIPVIHAAARPVVAALMGDTLIQEAVERFRAARIPEYRFPERAASALAVLAERAERLAAPEDGLPRPADIDQAAARRALDSGAAGQFLPPEAAAALLAAYRIPLAPLSLAQTAGEAAELAAAMGFPAALKVASPDISHKSEAGGVLLNLNTPAQVRVGFRRLLRRVQAARPGAALLGAHVQRMLPPGQEVIAGVLQDAQFGPVVMFGSGGVEVEGLKDVAFALAPLSAADAAYLLQATWAGRRLAGYRNLPPADRQAVLETLARLAWLAADFPEIAEIEINPLRVFPAGQGAIALDARALLKPATP